MTWITELTSVESGDYKFQPCDVDGVARCDWYHDCSHLAFHSPFWVNYLRYRFTWPRQ
jgi:hypothetical protein